MKQKNTNITTAVTVNKDCTAIELKEAAMKKHKEMHCQLIPADEDFLLVYSNNQVVNYIPSGKKKFSPVAYRDYLGHKNRYDRIRLYLVKSADFEAYWKVSKGCYYINLEGKPIPKASDPPLSDDPEITFGKKNTISGPSDMLDATLPYECYICKGDDRENLTRLECNCVFHKECIEEWHKLEETELDLMHCPACDNPGTRETKVDIDDFSKIDEVPPQPPQQILAEGSSTVRKKKAVKTNKKGKAPVTKEERGAWFRQVYLHSLELSPTSNEKGLEERRLEVLNSLDEVQQIYVQRHKIFETCLEIYSTTNVATKQVTFSIEGEIALDFDGVKREVYSTFFDHAIHHFFEGVNTFVPRVSPDIDVSEFETLGKIISHCFVSTGMFPTALNQIYVTTLVTGEDELTDEDLLYGLQELVSDYDAILIKEALREAEEGLLADSTKESLLNLLSEYQVKKLPTASNLKDILVSVAKVEFVSKPHAATTSIAKGMSEGPYSALWDTCGKHEISSLYKKLQITPDTVTSMLQVSDMASLSKEKNEVFSYLKKYVRSLSPSELKRFLRYVTGSSLPVVRNIQVIFHNIVGTLPHVLVHTCSAIIDLPSKGYLHYQDFRAQFDSVLDCAYAWEFGSL